MRPNRSHTPHTFARTKKSCFAYVSLTPPSKASRSCGSREHFLTACRVRTSTMNVASSTGHSAHHLVIWRCAVNAGHDLGVVDRLTTTTRRALERAQRAVAASHAARYVLVAGEGADLHTRRCKLLAAWHRSGTKQGMSMMARRAGMA